MKKINHAPGDRFLHGYSACTPLSNMPEIHALLISRKLLTESHVVLRISSFTASRKSFRHHHGYGPAPYSVLDSRIIGTLRKKRTHRGWFTGSLQSRLHFPLCSHVRCIRFNFPTGFQSRQYRLIHRDQYSGLETNKQTKQRVKSLLW